MSTDVQSAEPAPNQLKRNSLGLPSAIAMSLAFISPTIGVIFISALIAGKAGLASPFVFILGTLGIALMASTLAQFTRRVTSAGTFYKFITLSLGRRAGFVAGMLLMCAYALQSPLNTNLFGGFVGDLLHTDFGISVPWWLLMIAVVIVVGALAWYSVHTSMQFDIAFLIAEVVVVAVLLVLIVIRGGDSGQAPAAFLPTSSSAGAGGLGQAFVFIVLAFFGFESCSTVAEEVRSPRRNLPIALIGSVVHHRLVVHVRDVRHHRRLRHPPHRRARLRVGAAARSRRPLHRPVVRHDRGPGRDIRHHRRAARDPHGQLPRAVLAWAGWLAAQDNRPNPPQTPDAPRGHPGVLGLHPGHRLGRRGRMGPDERLRQSRLPVLVGHPADLHPHEYRSARVHLAALPQRVLGAGPRRVPARCPA